MAPERGLAELAGLLTAAETAAKFGVSTTTLRRWIARDWIQLQPSAVIGRSLLFSRSEVERLCEKRRS